ncbi:MAG: thioredoxin domain-containing protein [Phycisphaeraceae bacterium]|nr:thioredoxin domain-containing protein [Phycisphaeraceae bacterium]
MPKSPGHPRTASASAQHPAQRPALPAATMVTGLLLLEVTIAATLMLAMESIWKFALPGCGGSQSPCAKASQSIWGTIPGLGWPVSFAGLAFWTGVLHAWIAAWVTGVIPMWLRWFIRAGAIVSLFFITVSIWTGILCPYCLTAHGANLLLWVLAEFLDRAPSPQPTRRWPLPLAGATGALALIVLLTLHAQAERAVEMDRQASSREIIKHSTQQPDTAPPAAARPDQPAHVFTGRYREGPEKSPIRVVVFSDYQCPDCRIIESQIRQISDRPDVSISHKHFPLCTECNPSAPNLHVNACNAARAAEAAGIVGGNDAFWTMHRWLFDRAGQFTQSDLRAQVESMGLDWVRFQTAMSAASTTDLIKSDIAEGTSLGIFRTPMIFINGVEMKGWVAGQAVARTVADVAAANPPARTAAADRPPTAAEKYVADWRDNPAIPVAPRPTSYAIGPADAKIRMIVFGDYFVPLAAEADAAVRALADSRGDIRYEYRFFPFSRACNPNVGADAYPLACRAAAAAEAAGQIGGAEAFWKMHAWLQKNAQGLSDASIRQAATSMGLDANALLDRMNSPSVAAAIQADVHAAARAGVNGIPTVIINDRTMPRWRLDGASVLEQAVNESAGRK